MQITIFSEPKIPQSVVSLAHKFLSVKQITIFSEPKIPQLCCDTAEQTETAKLQSSASRKFLNGYGDEGQRRILENYNLQRAENSSICGKCCRATRRRQKNYNLQRAENSSIQTLAPASIHISDRDDHASSFLSLPGASP